MFKFALGALVVLETSRAAYFQQLEDDAEERRIEALPESERPVGVATLRARTIVEKGTVIGRAEYGNGLRDYRVRYVAADGCQTEDWFQDDAIFEPEVAVSDQDGAAGKGDARGDEEVRTDNVWERLSRKMMDRSGPLISFHVGPRPATALFGGDSQRSFTTRSPFGGNTSTSTPTEAEGFTELYGSIYEKEREADGSTSETAHAAAERAVRLFIETQGRGTPAEAPDAGKAE